MAPSLQDRASELLLAVGEVVVYASHGIGCVEAKSAGPEDVPETIVVAFAGGLKVTFPVAVARCALRPPSSELELEDVRRILRAEPSPSVESWSRRFNSMREKVTAGRATDLAEVVRDGFQRERLAAARTAAPSERHLYLRARTLLAAEIAHVRGIDALEADDWIVEQIDESARTSDS
jgi:RNA polymerase-interacting CarD/CdnL/TRCF family regulator